MPIDPSRLLPADADRALLVGRVWVDDPHPGPRPVLVRNGTLLDLSALGATTSDLFELSDLVASLTDVDAPGICTLADALHHKTLLVPCDLQAVKAAGVTFAESMIERVIEERAHGALEASAGLRARLNQALGGSLSGIEPGSPAADRVRQVLIEDGLWSQYLEVAIGPDAEIFTKAQPLSAVGCGALVGVHPDSTWSCSEPEVVLSVNSAGTIVGATLGNDLTLRDFEGRSALLLARAKDNNASCAIGPFVRLFDQTFDLDDVRGAEVDICIDGADGFQVAGTSSLASISRDPAALVGAALNATHQYPDGMMLFLGTTYIPNLDRHGPGSGFSHETGDRIRISSPRLGSLVNEVTTADEAPPWTFGVRALIRSLATRGLS